VAATSPKPLEITRRLLTQNWVLNLASQSLPLLVAVPCIPYVIRKLGTERFGLLSIAWALLGYLGLFDLGLGRATTKFVAECLGRGEPEKMPALAWTSLASQVLFGIAGALLAAAAIPVLARHVLTISPALVSETESSFFLLAGALPVVLAANSLRGVLEAAQRFDLVNGVKVPVNASFFLLPVLAASFGARLPSIVLLLVLARIAAGAAYLHLCFKVFPALRRNFSIDARTFRELLGYGGWVTVSNIVSPLLAYLDRFVIGSMMSMTFVGYYTAPSEAVTRASVVPSSLATTIFPAFSSLDAAGSKKKLEELCLRSVKSLLILLGPILLLVIAFAREILRIWLGAEFSDRGSSVLRILAMGMLVNSVAFVPFGLLQGLGRPDVTAKIHLAEIPAYGLLLWFLVKHLGLAGAAAAWTIRITVDAGLLFGASACLKYVSFGGRLSSTVWKAAGLVFLFGVLLVVPALTTEPLAMRTAYAGVLLLSFALVAWRYLLDGKDRGALLNLAGRFRAAFAAGR
jgi:O-antigen/teichoic acid export membrane protein